MCPPKKLMLLMKQHQINPVKTNYSIHNIYFLISLCRKLLGKTISKIIHLLEQSRKLILFKTLKFKQELSEFFVLSNSYFDDTKTWTQCMLQDVLAL